MAAKHSLAAERSGVSMSVRNVSYLRGAHTPLYASPQQRDGQPPDPRDDVHALGVIWYQLLTGDLGSGAPTGLWTDDLEEQGVQVNTIAGDVVEG